MKNDRIAILSRNGMVYIDTFYSTIYTGAITTAYNVHLLPEELAALINNEQPKIIFYEKEFEEKVIALKNMYTSHTMSFWTKMTIRLGLICIKKSCATTIQQSRFLWICPWRILFC